MDTRNSRRAGAVLVTMGTALLVPAGLAFAQNTEVDEPDSFTSMYSVVADSAQVPDGGQDGAMGTFNLRVNSDEDILCYEISLNGVDPGPTAEPAPGGMPASAALTATHLHEGLTGVAGPPRIVVDDPGGDADPLTSEGCVQGPFQTGVLNDMDVDQGEGFTLAELEADPSEYYVDVHTVDFVPGAIRGQLTEVPMGGVETGAGGTAATAGDRLESVAFPLALGGLTALFAGLLIRRRVRA